MIQFRPLKQLEPHMLANPSPTIISTATQPEQSRSFKKADKSLSTAQGKSSLKRLMDRYNQGKSYLATMIDWYGQTSWLGKAVMGLAFVAIGALIGSIIQLAIVFAILASCLYLVMHFFTMDELNIKNAREPQLVADIKMQEKSHEQTATKLNDYVQKLDTLNQKIYTPNPGSVDNSHADVPLLDREIHSDLAQFEHDINILKEQIKTFEIQIATHEQTTTDLKEAKDTLQETCLLLQITIDNLTKQITALNSDVTKLTATNAGLLQQNAALRKTNQELQASLMARNENKTKIDPVETDETADRIIKKLNNMFTIFAPSPLAQDEAGNEEKNNLSSNLDSKNSLTIS